MAGAGQPFAASLAALCLEAKPGNQDYEKIHWHRGRVSVNPGLVQRSLSGREGPRRVTSPARPETRKTSKGERSANRYAARRPRPTPGCPQGRIDSTLKARCQVLRFRRRQGAGKPKAAPFRPAPQRCPTPLPHPFRPAPERCSVSASRRRRTAAASAAVRTHIKCKNGPLPLPRRLRPHLRPPAGGHPARQVLWKARARAAGEGGDSGPRAAADDACHAAHL